MYLDSKEYINHKNTYFSEGKIDPSRLSLKEITIGRVKSDPIQFAKRTFPSQEAVYSPKKTTETFSLLNCNADESPFASVASLISWSKEKPRVASPGLNHERGFESIPVEAAQLRSNGILSADALRGINDLISSIREVSYNGEGINKEEVLEHLTWLEGGLSRATFPEEAGEVKEKLGKALVDAIEALKGDLNLSLNNELDTV